MRPYLLLLLSIGFVFSVKAAPETDSTILLQLPDSIKAIQFHAEINVQQLNPNGQASAGISTDLVKLSLENGRISKHIAFTFPAQAKVVAQGLNTEIKKNRIVWAYNWNKQENYKLLISIAGDSAENFVLYSGYIWLPVENKWKLLGTCRIEGTWSTIKDPAIFTSAKKIKEEGKISLTNGAVWVQGRNNRWYNLLGESKINPMINLYPHLDSLVQAQNEIQLIEKAISDEKTDTRKNTGGVYYSILSEGTGRQVALTDTVTVYYKGYLFDDGLVFDKTGEKPATFPLNRLIRGWQLAVPMAKVGSRIKLVIPSGLGYSIRTRAAKIPPNSILVFEIEVVDAKPGT